MAKHAAFDTLKPTFSKVDQIISRSRQSITSHLDPLLAQLQTAEVIRSSQSSLELEFADIRKLLNDDLKHKNDRSMFSAKYYTLLMSEISALKTKLRQQFHDMASVDLSPNFQPVRLIAFLQLKGWLISLQLLLTILVAVGIYQQRHCLTTMEEWRFISSSPLKQVFSLKLFRSACFMNPFQAPQALFMEFGASDCLCHRRLYSIDPDFKRNVG